MTSTPRFWFVGGIVAALLIAILGWTMVISPRMEAVAQTRTEAEDLTSQADMVMAQVQQLQAQADDLPQQIDALMRIQRRIPSSVDVPALLRDIQHAAKVHDVTVHTLTPGRITVFTSQAEAEKQASSSSSSEPAATPDQTAAPAPQPSPSEMGQGQLPEGVGLSYVPITITAGGQFDDIEAFTAQIEELQRAYLITGVQLSREQVTVDGKQANDLSVTLETRVFLANDRLKNLPAKALDQVGDR